MTIQWASLIAVSLIFHASALKQTGEHQAIRFHDRRSSPPLYYLDILQNNILRVDLMTGEEVEVVNSTLTGMAPDGIAVDEKHIYWTDMGTFPLDDGQIRRANLDGTDVTTIVDGPSLKLPGAFTPKQLIISHSKLYWGNREGMMVMRSNVDGSSVEILVEAGQPHEMKDESKHCVGVAVDVANGHLYWTQKGDTKSGHGSIRRASLDLARGEGPANRSDISVLFDNQPWPVDVELDLTNRMLYWTDGTAGTVNRANMDSDRWVREELVNGLSMPIGLDIDLGTKQLCFASSHDVSCADLDGKNMHKVADRKFSHIAKHSIAKQFADSFKQFKGVADPFLVTGLAFPQKSWED